MEIQIFLLVIVYFLMCIITHIKLDHKMSSKRIDFMIFTFCIGGLYLIWKLLIGCKNTILNKWE